VVIERRAARTLLLVDRSVLLIRGRDPARPEAGAWWLTPGGGVEAGESLAAAAVREVQEETGLVLPEREMGPVVATRRAEFSFDGSDYEQTEWFFAVRVERFEPGAAGWDAIERRALLHHRWWSVEDLETTDDRIYPLELPGLMRALLDGRVHAPVRLSGQ
jgi:8-oxo-dGTP pyrophosphatase MutT (NUDIX family)